MRVMHPIEQLWYQESIEDVKQTLVEALYVALKPGSLPSLIVFVFDCFLTACHYGISSYIPDDFTTTFLSTVYFPCTFLKVIYIVELFYTSLMIRDINDTINQVFNMTIILSCIGYNIICVFVAKYRKTIPLPVIRSIFLPIFLFCSFLVVAPKVVLNTTVDKFFQFATQLFGSIFLLAQIFVNLYIYVFRKDIREQEKKEMEKNGPLTNANDVIRNANGRLIWANVFSFILVLLTIPQIIDYYVPLSPGWISYHFLIQSLSQLNPLFLSFTTFLVLPTFRSVIFGRCINYKRMENVIRVKPAIIDETPSIDVEKDRKIFEKVEEKKESEQPQQLSVVPYQHYQPYQPIVPQYQPQHQGGHLRIFMAPTFHHPLFIHHQ